MKTKKMKKTNDLINDCSKFILYYFFYLFEFEEIKGLNITKFKYNFFGF